MAISQPRIDSYLEHRDFELECYFAAMMADPERRERVMQSQSGEALASAFAAFIELHPLAASQLVEAHQEKA